MLEDPCHISYTNLVIYCYIYDFLNKLLQFNILSAHKILINYREKKKKKKKKKKKVIFINIHRNVILNKMEIYFLFVFLYICINFTLTNFCYQKR
ncbi:hypothetical protein PFBG_02134 [Plasmodium falciparum 7G8]|uniref:Uncharacterized protein n=1 Tax=Plasmodium falciparum (isolate 7G8) TaxID=57266 RepID=W7F340_PLAF8|nr:hypothetical protein PFBG_02134 [Plasmodium falciparum 7G8]